MTTNSNEFFGNKNEDSWIRIYELQGMQFNLLTQLIIQ